MNLNIKHINSNNQSLINGIKIFYMVYIKKVRYSKLDFSNLLNRSIRSIDYYISAINCALLELMISVQLVCIDGIITII